MSGAFGIKPFSALVDLWLECGEVRVPLSEVGYGFVSAVKPIYLPAQCRVTIVVSIDGREHRKHAVLAHGMTEFDTETRIAALR